MVLGKRIGKHPIDDMEWVRDYNFRAMFGAWDTLKNVDGMFPKHRLKWAAYIIGKRESRRLLGDVVLTADHFREKKIWPDPAFPCTWHIDLHSPDPRFADPSLVEPFIARATDSPEYRYQGPYWAPYRCLYSRNINNLFMAGRDISVSHDGLGAVRVMRTCGMMGETVGKAAWIAVRYNSSPRGVYADHLDLLKQLMSEPGVKRRESLTGELKLPPGAVVVSGRLAKDALKLGGIIIDDSAAELTGSWQDNGSLSGFVGYGYLYSSDPKASAKFKLRVPKDGLYDVRVTWQPHPNRAKSLQVELRTGDETHPTTLNQTKPAEGKNDFQSLGVFDLKSDHPSELIFKVNNANGTAHIDAIQLLEVEERK